MASKRKKTAAECIANFLLCVSVLLVLCLVVGKFFATFADSLPPSPAEESGQIPMGPVK